MDAAPPRLDVQGLTRFLGGRCVVNDVSFSTEAGQVTCLLGPSGCGKSTVLRMIAGIDQQDAGSVAVDGIPLSNELRHDPPETRGIGLMFQDFALFPHLSVADNVGFGLSGAKRDKQDRVASLLERVRLSHMKDSFPHQLSGGEQQRVALARAIAPKPRVMLMDEPFSGLDNRLRDGIRDQTLEVLTSEGAAVVMVTHEPDEAMRVADQIALMRGGEIIQCGGAYNVYTSPLDKYAAAFFSDINVLSGKVQGALIENAFGQFLAPGHPNGTDVEIVIRPQHLRLDFDRQGKGPDPTPQDGVPARGTVVRSRFVGNESMVEFKMDHDGSVLKAIVPSVFLPKPGKVMWLMMRRDRCFVFPARRT